MAQEPIEDDEDDTDNEPQGEMRRAALAVLKEITPFHRHNLTAAARAALDWLADECGLLP